MNETQKLEEAYNKFIEEVEIAKKEHREKINVILKRIEKRKTKELQKKIKSL